MDERERIWRDRIARQQRSDLTVAECCEADGVSVASFYRWKKLLKGMSSPQQRREPKCSPEFVPLVVRGALVRPNEGGTESERPQTGSPSCAQDPGGVRVELPNGVVILLPPDLDGQRLGDVTWRQVRLKDLHPG